MSVTAGVGAIQLQRNAREKKTPGGFDTVGRCRDILVITY